MFHGPESETTIPKGSARVPITSNAANILAPPFHNNGHESSRGLSAGPRGTIDGLNPRLRATRRRVIPIGLATMTCDNDSSASYVFPPNNSYSRVNICFRNEFYLFRYIRKRMWLIFVQNSKLSNERENKSGQARYLILLRYQYRR